MNIVQAFDSHSIRFVEHPEGKYGFGIVAADLALVLDIQNTADMIKPIDDGWKGVDNIYTPGGTQSVTVIWEPGVYQILSRSRKPQAKPFQKWLFEEVLPSIRKTGSYSLQAPAIAPSRDTIDYIEAAATLSHIEVNSHLRLLLEDALTDELELSRNQKLLGPTKKQYTIVKVRAKELGYTDQQIGSGSRIGKFVASQLPCAFSERVGKFSVRHYEVSPKLDETIHAYFR